MDSGTELATLTGHTEVVTAVAVTPDGCRAVSGSYDGILKVWDLDSGRELATLIGHTARINAVVVTPDGHHAISVSSDCILKIWSLENWAEGVNFYADSELHSVAFSDVTNSIIAGDQCGNLHFIKLENDSL